jgi:hypothetical protein
MKLLYDYGLCWILDFYSRILKYSLLGFKSYTKTFKKDINFFQKNLNFFSILKRIFSYGTDILIFSINLYQNPGLVSQVVCAFSNIRVYIFNTLFLEIWRI